MSQLPPHQSLSSAHLGVNIAGYINGEFGIGEGVRANIRSMEAANIPFVINNFDLNFHRKQDTTYQNFSDTNPYPINLIQVNADEVKNFINKIGHDYLKNRYNIGFWAWELPNFPTELQDVFPFFNEIWTYSNHCLGSISLAAPIPVLRIMPSLNLPIPDISKKDLGLPEDKFIFMFVFDFASTLTRKNVLGTIASFIKAFGPDHQDVLLVIKSSNSEFFPKSRSTLHAMLEGKSAILHLDGYLSRPEINALLYHCHCYVSLHRAEGFGLTMAEAMFYGKPVIATGYSSNIEFMNPWNSFLVKYKLVELTQDYGPYKKGNFWADPDLNQAADLMQYVYQNYAQATQIGTQAAQDIQSLLNPQIIGAQIKQRFQAIVNRDIISRPLPKKQEQLEIFLPLLVNKKLDIPLVSICIPTYNGATFIADALTSAIAQTYANIEIIISDDGSTDNTIEIAQKIQQQTNRDIKIILHSNYGLCHNWNFCIKHAQGTYIKFLFQDDKLAPECVAQMVELAEQDPQIGLVFAPRHLVLGPDAEKNHLCMLAYQAIKDLHQKWSNLQTIQPGINLIKDPEFLKNPINKIGEPSNVLIKKSVFEEIGLFDPELRQYLDLEMWFRIMGYYKIGFVNTPLSDFTIHPEQTTWRNYLAGENQKDVLRLYQKMLDNQLYNFLPRELKERLTEKITASSPALKLTMNIPELQTLVKEYMRSLEQPNLVNNLRQIREQIAKYLLEISPKQLLNSHALEIGKAYKLLCLSGLVYEKLTDSEVAILKEISEKLADLKQSAKSINYLLALRLYKFAHQLHINYETATIPYPLLHEFLEFLLTIPNYFQKIDERDIFSKYFREKVIFILNMIKSFSEVEIGAYMAGTIARGAYYLPLYLTNSTTLEIATNWAQILQFYVESNPHNLGLSYFHKSQPSTIIKLGILVENSNNREKLAILSILANLPKHQFEITLYSTHDLIDNWTQGDQTIILPTELSAQVSQIRQANLDILLIGTNPLFKNNQPSHKVNNNLALLCLYRLARCHITTISITPVTTGISNIDYYITGSFTATKQIEQEYCEKVKLIKGSGLCFATPKLTEKPTVHPTRKSWGAQDESIVFISSANFTKLLPELRLTWGKILALVPNSILVLYPFRSNQLQAAATHFLNETRNLFTNLGINYKRLIILNFLGTPENFQECLKLGDIYLDSFPLTGASSLISPLSLGLPSIVWEGHNCREKQAAAMLRELQLPGLIAHSEQGYIDLAVQLASDASLRGWYRQQIQEKMAAIPAFLDGEHYGRLLSEMLRNLSG